MGFLQCFSENWFTFLNVIGIVGGLLFNGFSLRSEAETRRVANLLAITANHRDTWKIILENPELKRVLAPALDLKSRPVTEEERLFVTLVIQHCHSAFQATRKHLVINVEGFHRDVWGFFTFPIPAAVWNKIKAQQNDEFVAFVERAIQEESKKA
jgi:hypothetical protein